MNDPHVQTLHYRIKHKDGVDYAKAPPLDDKQPAFTVRIEEGRAIIHMQSHHTTADEARAVVEPYLRDWELSAILERGPGEIEFVYEHADIIDRNPTPTAGQHLTATLHTNISQFPTVTVKIERATWPAPAAGIKLDPVVEFMVQRYSRYKEGKEGIAHAANYCLTEIEDYAGGRKGAANYYRISMKILTTLGDLAANKGGDLARKARGARIPYSAAERAWLEAAMQKIIRRAAQVAFDPHAVRQQITMTDLPAL